MKPSPQNLKQSPYSAKNNIRRITFMCLAPDAQSVFLAGEFNQWNAQTHPMQKGPDGAWRVDVDLHHGHHQYWFLVDGKPVLDPRANGISRNERNERVSMIAVS